MFRILKIAHVSLIVADTTRALEFYQGLLELSEIERPDMAFPGAWLDMGSAHLHLLELPNPDPVEGRPEHGGRDRHVALYIDDMDGLCARMDERGIPYTLSRSGRRACFFRDPDGNALECIEA